MEWEVAKEKGGEEGLRRLCEEAADKGLRLVSWMAAANSPRSDTFMGLADAELGLSDGFAAMESGRHPWTGDAPSYWPLNLANPKVWENWIDRILGVCERTGLAGFLWDSYCNMGWWQVDYPGQTMKPNAEGIAKAYAALANAGLYLIPEALVTFSNHSAVGLHAGNVYEGDMLAFAYNCNQALHFTEDGQKGGDWCQANRILKGERPIDMLFQCYAHKRSPGLGLHRVPRDKWDERAATQIRETIAMYKRSRPHMKKRTVLPDQAGVVWEDGGPQRVFFSFRNQDATVLGSPATVADVLTGNAVTDGKLLANRAYRFSST
jgi:hypothetical protein